MAILWHGTTRDCANRIVAMGPDEQFVEPGAHPRDVAGGFSTTLAGHVPRPGDPSCEEYARFKAKNIPNEGGPAIVEVEVPDGIVDLVRVHPVGWIAFADSGELRFEPGMGWDELIREWPNLTKRIRVP